MALPLLIPGIIATVTAVAGFKIGQDTPNPATLPDNGKTISFLEIGGILILGIMGFSLIRLMRDLFAG